MAERAFALKDTVSDFAGASGTWPDGTTYDLGARLRANDGVITVDETDEQQLVILQGFTGERGPLKELRGAERAAAVGDDAPAAKASGGKQTRAGGTSTAKDGD